MGVNVINGTQGNDGPAWSDSLWGTPDDDFIKGKKGDDRLLGGNGDDKLSGGKGSDWLSGGAGDDVLHGSGERDVLIGGAGHDIFDFGRDDSLVGRWERDFVLDYKQGEDHFRISPSLTWTESYTNPAGIDVARNLAADSLLHFWDKKGNEVGQVLVSGVIDFHASDFIGH
jgi:Ca2+-binding RTX toxin-like protein